MFIQPEIQSAIDRSLPTPADQRNAPGTNESARVSFAGSFYQDALPKFWFLSHIDSLLTIGDRHRRKVAAAFKTALQQIHFRFYGTGAFSCGVPLFVWGFINTIWLL